jgi:hypothetical protein
VASLLASDGAVGDAAARRGRHAIDDDRHEAAIAAHEATVKALLAQARREQAVGSAR